MRGELKDPWGWPGPGRSSQAVTREVGGTSVPGAHRYHHRMTAGSRPGSEPPAGASLAAPGRGRWASPLVLSLSALLLFAQAAQPPLAAAPQVHLSPSDPWPTLKPGSVVTLAPGVYPGPWVVEVENVRVQGEGATITGVGEGSTVVLAAAGIAVVGLAVAGAGPEYDLYAPDAAFWLVDCHQCSLAGVSAVGAPTGVRIDDSRGVSVVDADLTGGPTAPGLTVFGSPGLRLESSRVTGFLDGIYLESADDATVATTEFLGAARYAMHTMYSLRTTLDTNLVRGGTVGSAAMYGRGLRASGNTFEGHIGPLSFGLLTLEVKDAVVADNAFIGNTIGTLVVSAPDISLEGNLFQDGGFGIVVQRSSFGGSSAVRITGNTFRGNVNDVAVDDPEASVSLYGNAFEAATRLDLDGDGVADVPHVPSSSFAMLASRQPDVSLYSLSPGVVLWESIEATVPAIRLMSLSDPAPRIGLDWHPAGQGWSGDALEGSRSGAALAAVLAAASLAVAGYLLGRPRGLPGARL